MGKSTISMAIFNSYVKLPEGIWCCNQTQGIDYQSVQRQGESANLLQPRSRQAAWVAAGMDVIMCPVQVWGVGLVWCVSCSHEFVYIIYIYMCVCNMVRHGLWPLVPCFTSTIICIIYIHFLAHCLKNKYAHTHTHTYIYIICIIMYLNSKGNFHFATGGRCWPWSWWLWGSLWWSCSPVTRPCRISLPFGRGRSVEFGAVRRWQGK